MLKPLLNNKKLDWILITRLVFFFWLWPGSSKYSSVLIPQNYKTEWKTEETMHTARRLTNPTWLRSSRNHRGRIPMARLVHCTLGRADPCGSLELRFAKSSTFAGGLRARGPERIHLLFKNSSPVSEAVFMLGSPVSLVTSKTDLRKFHILAMPADAAIHFFWISEKFI